MYRILYILQEARVICWKNIIVDHRKYAFHCTDFH